MGQLQKAIVKKTGQNLQYNKSFEGDQTQHMQTQSLKHSVQAGDLYYCKKRGKTQCCFENEECEENWFAINKKVDNEDFLTILQSLCILRCPTDL